MAAIDTAVKAKDFSANPSEKDLRAFFDGSLSVTDSIDALISRGMGYHVSIGAFSTAIQGGGAGTILDIDQPEGVVSVPANTTIRLVRVSVQCHVPLLAADADESEILLAVDRANSWDGDGTFTTEGVFNLRTDLGGGTNSGPVQAASAFTADMLAGGADPVLGLELARSVMTADSQTAVGVLWAKLDLLYEPKHPPFIVGPAAVYLYWGGTVATTGFAQVQFVAFPSGLVKSLA